MGPGEQVLLECADLDDDGAGVGDVSGTALHVPGALPREQVEATVAHVSSHTPTAWGYLQRVAVPSPDRRPPVCPGFGSCGGCVIQHLDYPAQLAWKRQRVARAFAAHATLQELAVAPCLPSPRVLGYRNNAKLVADRGPGGVVLGGYAPRSHEVVDLIGCRVVEPAVDGVASSLRGLLAEAGVPLYDERKLTGCLRYVVLRANHAGQVLCALIVARPLPDGEALAQRLVAQRPEVAGVVEQENRTRGNAIFALDATERVLAGQAQLEDQVVVPGAPTIRVRLSAGTFFQANREMAAVAYAALADALAVRPGERVIDAYSGVGAIGLLLAGTGAEVLGIESHPGAVANATAAAALNGIGTARFVAGDAAAGLATATAADVVVVNPPRKGCAPEVLRELARLAPRAIGYLSCDPDTLARDLAQLAAHGYRPRAVTPLDMLPHTTHVETIAILDR